MKKYLLYFLFCLVATVPVKSHAQNPELSFACFYDGYWGEWHKPNDCDIWGSYGGFIVYQCNQHPSNYSFKFQIDSYVKPSKDEIKAHWKSKQPFVYRGTVEYYLSNVCPTAKDVLKRFYLPFITASLGGTKTVTSAEIQILPYKKHPECYNIFFEDVAVAISLGASKFPE